jgi:hypothetical protein
MPVSASTDTLHVAALLWPSLVFNVALADCN